MNEKEQLMCVIVGAVALWVGYRFGQKKAQAAQQANPYGDGTGSGAFAMDWFTSYGKGV